MRISDWSSDVCSSDLFGDYYEPRILTFQVSVDGDGCPGCAPEVLETFLLPDGVSPGRATLDQRAPLTVEGDLNLHVTVDLDEWHQIGHTTCRDVVFRLGQKQLWTTL